MAYKNKIISNPATKQDIQFLQTGKETNGQLLEMISTYQERSKEPPAHYHPFQEEHFTVISGELTVRIDGDLRILKKGDSLHVPKNEVHAMWNASDAKTVVTWKVQPAMNTDHFLETAVGLAIDGKTNRDGRPHLLQAALMANKYSDVFRLAGPPYPLQRVIFGILTPIAYMLGYKPDYIKYFD